MKDLRVLWEGRCKRVPGAGCRVPGAGCQVPGAELNIKLIRALLNDKCATDNRPSLNNPFHFDLLILTFAL